MLNNKLQKVKLRAIICRTKKIKQISTKFTQKHELFVKLSKKTKFKNYIFSIKIYICTKNNTNGIKFR